MGRSAQASQRAAARGPRRRSANQLPTSPAAVSPPQRKNHGIWLKDMAFSPQRSHLLHRRISPPVPRPAPGRGGCSPGGGRRRGVRGPVPPAAAARCGTPPAPSSAFPCALLVYLSLPRRLLEAERRVVVHAVV